PGTERRETEDGRARRFPTPLVLNAAEWPRHEVTVDQRELVDRASRGDHDAFGELVGASVAQLGAVAGLILRDPDLARDAVQDALIRAWRDLPGLRDPDRLAAWLHRLTVNACID